MGNQTSIDKHFFTDLFEIEKLRIIQLNSNELVNEAKIIEKRRYILNNVFNEFGRLKLKRQQHYADHNIPTKTYLTKTEFYMMASQFVKEYDEYIPILWRDHYSRYIEKELAVQPLTVHDYSMKLNNWKALLKRAEEKFHANVESIIVHPEMQFSSWYSKLEEKDESGNGFISKKIFVTKFWSSSQLYGFRFDQPWETFGLRDGAMRIIGKETDSGMKSKHDEFLEDGNENINNNIVHSNIETQYTDAITRRMLTVDDFELLTVVGKGSFGKVMQVRKRDTGEIFAMKTLKKSVLVKRRQVAHTQTERKILGNIRHPFIVSLKYAFQTKTKLYMILEYFNGGELFFHLREGRFTETRSKFYAAELACALQCLHDHNIIYRDLKPENVLLDADGHIKLTDFGLSKEAADLTHTFCGTPAYLAPEIIAGEYYGKIVDWWSLGTLLYEMLCGLPPFYHSNQNQMYKLIMTAKLNFPSHLSHSAVVILKKLLRRDPSNRLGAKRGIEELKEEDFFGDIDWELLEKRKLTPPFKPQVDKGSLDTANVDEEFTREMPRDSPDVVSSMLNQGHGLKFDKFTFDGSHE